MGCRARGREPDGRLHPVYTDEGGRWALVACNLLPGSPTAVPVGHVDDTECTTTTHGTA